MCRFVSILSFFLHCFIAFERVCYPPLFTLYSANGYMIYQFQWFYLLSTYFVSIFFIFSFDIIDRYRYPCTVNVLLKLLCFTGFSQTFRRRSSQSRYNSCNYVNILICSHIYFLQPNSIGKLTQLTVVYHSPVTSGTFHLGSFASSSIWLSAVSKWLANRICFSALQKYLENPDN